MRLCSSTFSKITNRQKIVHDRFVDRISGTIPTALTAAMRRGTDLELIHKLSIDLVQQMLPRVVEVLREIGSEFFEFGKYASESTELTETLRNFDCNNVFCERVFAFVDRQILLCARVSAEHAFCVQVCLVNGTIPWALSRQDFSELMQFSRKLGRQSLKLESIQHSKLIRDRLCILEERQEEERQKQTKQSTRADGLHEKIDENYGGLWTSVSTAQRFLSSNSENPKLCVGVKGADRLLETSERREERSAVHIQGEIPARVRIVVVENYFGLLRRLFPDS